MYQHLGSSPALSFPFAFPEAGVEICLYVAYPVEKPVRALQKGEIPFPINFYSVTFSTDISEENLRMFEVLLCDHVL